MTDYNPLMTDYNPVPACTGNAGSDGWIPYYIAFRRPMQPQAGDRAPSEDLIISGLVVDGHTPQAAMRRAHELLGGLNAEVDASCTTSGIERTVSYSINAWDLQTPVPLWHRPIMGPDRVLRLNETAAKVVTVGIAAEQPQA